MNWNEYVALAIRTESVPQNWFSELPGLDTDDIDSEDSRQLNTSINTRATRLLHATMGICTELVELADGFGTVNFVEEVGDVLWYLAIADDVIDWRKCNRVCEPKSNLYWIGELNDAMKRHLFYGTELNIDKIVTACIAIYHGLVVALSDRQLLIEAAMEANIEKLSKRYPNKYFDKTDAVNRNVENELSHILGEDFADKLVVEAKAKILTPTGFMEIVRSNLTNYQQIQALKSLAFMVADQLRKSGALAEARAYDAMYRSCTESAIEAGDISFVNLWVRLGFPSSTADEVREQLERWK